jgi:hypothetical protein
MVGVVEVVGEQPADVLQPLVGRFIVQKLV